ncbi:MAG: DTW domain-containing protein, partial [Deltaproteobacteria bacterium]|nr:DTW domain-containing protein [Deltaproteobacteria bacterium]
MPTLDVDARPTCYRCFKPRSTCVCSSITPVDNRTRVFVLQHPRERAHPIGTARFVDLGLSNSELISACSAARDLRVPMALPPGTGLLFPREDARDLEDVPTSERPRQLVVLDGTWSQARTLYRQNAWLHALPHFRLSPSAPSRYRIRREPSPECVSTLESVLLALRILEPETRGFPALLRAFDAMIDAQIRRVERAQRAGVGKRRRRSLDQRRFRGVPRWLGDGFERLVGLYAEALSVDDDDGARQRALLSLSAVRFATGEPFERMVVPTRGLPGDRELLPLGLCRADFEHAISSDVLAADLAAFLGADSVCVSWNGITPSLMHEATGQAHRVRLLRPVVRGLEHFGIGVPGAAGASPDLDRLV